MVSKNTNKVKKMSGFTIVELLIVIVVIGILAAITIVAYNGVQNKAKTTSAQSAANSVIKKAELFNADDSATYANYPVSIAALTTGQSGKTYELTGVTSGTPGATVTPATVNLTVCPTGALAGAATGVTVTYWDYGAGSAKSLKTGSC